jgi:hypothetical protein
MDRAFVDINAKDLGSSMFLNFSHYPPVKIFYLYFLRLMRKKAGFIMFTASIWSMFPGLLLASKVGKEMTKTMPPLLMMMRAKMPTNFIIFKFF